PKLSLSYQTTQNSMLYANVSRGFKPGGFNPQPTATDTFTRFYAKETTTAYETGFKTTWLEGGLVADAALFYTDYANFQYFAFINGNDVTYTADKVKVKGAELSVAVHPLPWFTFD